MNPWQPSIHYRDPRRFEYPDVRNRRGASQQSPGHGLLKRVASSTLEATVDAEVLQEIIQRYRALHRWPEGRQVYTLTRSLFPEILPITGAVMDNARQLADEYGHMSARDAIHAAVVVTYKLKGICTFDRDFDRISQCPRVGLKMSRSSQ